MKIRLCLLLLPLAAFPSLAHAVPVKIIVTDPDAKPVAGAKVEYYSAASYKYKEGTKPVLNVAQTGVDGTLTLDLPEPEKTKAQLQAEVEAGEAIPRIYLGQARVLAPEFAYATTALRDGDNPVKLSKASQISGLINGPDGKPAASVKVKLRGVSPLNRDERYMYYSRDFPDIETTTGADGAWTLGSAPTEGIAQLETEGDNLQMLRFQAVIEGNKAEAPLQTLKKGGTLRGRVVTGEGKPLEGATVRVDNIWDRVFTVGADGTYMFKGIGAGKHTVRVNMAEGEWLPPAEGPTVTMPEEAVQAQAPDVVAVKGVLVSGRLLDKETKAPITGMEMWMSSSVSREVTTDEQGRFSARVAPGNLYLSSSGRTQNYRGPGMSRDIPAGIDTLDVGDILLERGYALKLDVRGEDDKPVPEAQLMVKSEELNTYTSWNAKEKTQVANALSPGKYTLTGRGGWEVLEPKEVTVTTAKDAAPIVVKLRQGTLPKVTGQVVDEEGKPMMGVAVSLALRAEAGYTRQQSVLSKRDGTWSISLEEPKMMPSVRRITFPGYQTTGGGEITRDGNDWKATNIVVSRNDAEMRGKVVDAQGKPLAGARISWPGAKDADLKPTDANGTFVLTGVPRGEITLWASTGNNFVATRGKAGQEVEVKIPTPAAPADLTALREKLWAEASVADFNSLANNWNVFGNERLLSAALRADGVLRADGTRDPSKAGRAVEMYLSMSARKDADNAARLGVDLLRQMPPKQPGAGTRQIAILAAQSKDEDLKAWAGQWFDTQKLRVSLQDPAGDAVENALAVGLVGTLLERPNAAAYRDLGLVLTDGKFTSNNATKAVEWGALLWQGGKDQFEDSIAEWNATAQMMAVAGALGRVNTAEEAKTLLARLEDFANNPAIKEYEAQSAADNRSWRPGLSYALGLGRKNAVNALATKDPQAALDVLPKFSEGYMAQGPAFTIAQGAIKAGKLDMAKAAARVGLKDSMAGRTGAARLAVLIQNVDPALSQELLDYVRQETQDDDNDYAQDWRTDAYYAFAIQKSDPGLGRILLEREWAQRQATKGGSEYQDSYSQQGVIWAMAAYDPARALEWLDKFPDQYGQKARLKADVTALIFADDQTRLLLRRAGED